MRLLATRFVICRKYKPVGIDRTPYPVDKVGNFVRELDLLALYVFYIRGPNHRYQHSFPDLLKIMCVFAIFLD
jgi:hypothetical protein